MRKLILFVLVLVSISSNAQMFNVMMAQQGGVVSGSGTPITAIANITGNYWVGYALTAGATTPSGATKTYQWSKCTTSGGTYSDIGGATSSTFTLNSSEVGYYIKVTVTGTGSYSGTVTSNATSAKITPVGQTAYTSPGTYSWTCPTGVTSVCVVLVGGAGQGTTYQYAGSLMYKNNYAVTAGNSYTVQVGQGSSTKINCRSWWDKDGSVYTYLFVGNYDDYNIGNADGGGLGSRSYGTGGGGAGGYAGDGGRDGDPGIAGSGGAGGGGSYYSDTDMQNGLSMGGGGVGILGQGSSGAGGTWSQGCTGCYDGSGNGKGGSGGGDGTYNDGDLYGYGGSYGGGGSGYNGLMSGAVRIIWGYNRSFPSTNTTNK